MRPAGSAVPRRSASVAFGRSRWVARFAFYQRVALLGGRGRLWLGWGWAGWGGWVRHSSRHAPNTKAPGATSSRIAVLGFGGRGRRGRWAAGLLVSWCGFGEALKTDASKRARCGGQCGAARSFVAKIQHDSLFMV